MRKGNIGSFDKHVTIFSREGRLFQVEYAFKASKNFGSTCIGLKGNDTVCGIIDQKNIELINDQYSTPNFFQAGDKIGCLCSGFPGDILMLKNYVNDEVSKYFFKFGHNIPIEYLNKKLSDKNQIHTQYAYTRPLAVKTIIIGVDSDLGPKLYKSDPSGHSSSQLVCAIGEKEEEVNNYVSKKLKYYTSSNFSQLITITNTILLLQRVLKRDVRTSDFKIVMSTTKMNKIRILDDDEVDVYLSYLENL
nr:26S proteasome IOTA SU [Cryptomonas sp.]